MMVTNLKHQNIVEVYEVYIYPKNVLNVVMETYPFSLSDLIVQYKITRTRLHDDDINVKMHILCHMRAHVVNTLLRA